MGYKRTFAILLGIVTLTLVMVSASLLTQENPATNKNAPHQAGTTVVAPAGSYYSIYFTQASSGWVKCDTSCITGGNKDLDIYLLGSADFVAYENSMDFTYFFYANHARLTDFCIYLAPDTYYLVLDNKFSAVTDKSVTYAITDLGTSNPTSLTWMATFVFTGSTQRYFYTPTFSSYSATSVLTVAANYFDIELMNNYNYQQKLGAHAYTTIDSQAYQQDYTHALPSGEEKLWFYVNYAYTDAVELSESTSYVLNLFTSPPMGIPGYDVMFLIFAATSAIVVLWTRQRKRY